MINYENLIRKARIEERFNLIDYLKYRQNKTCFFKLINKKDRKSNIKNKSFFIETEKQKIKKVNNYKLYKLLNNKTFVFYYGKITLIK